MDPTATPPWRVLETTTTTDAAPQPPERPGSTASPAAAPSTVLKAIAIGGAAVACAVAAVVFAMGSEDGTVRVEGGSPLTADATAMPATSGIAAGPLVIVEIVGAVREPGVYSLPAGSRLADLVRQAGGYGPRVDVARAEQELNLAGPLRDGDHVRVPSRDDRQTAGTSAPADDPRSAGTALIDINRATQSELEELPGVGPATAEKIIAAREEAPFTAVEELRSRGVLGEKTFEKLRALVTVD
jgi:competence protein ComEA